ncbi:hypothetical protein GBAR_LOCUS6684 [Geodia barretti]|uniref:Uncharacterized protein n=1 Tax=Geodia barretti TaxID=519541 RepID=A0AA35RHA2_GEOBA|nr:hypothetical protein GBAR_LOCUS6684 [Geodia barretti]
MKSVSVGSSRPAVSNPLRTRVSSDMASVPSEEHSPTSSYNAYPGDAEHPPAYPGRDVEAGVGPSGAAAPHGGAGGEEQRSTNGELHRRLSMGSTASTESSVNENLEVASVTSSIEDRLTYATINPA